MTSKKKQRRAKQRTGEVIGGTTHIIPITLTKFDSRSPPLDAGAIHQDMDLTAHGFQRFVKYAFDRVEVGNVALDNLDIARGGRGGGCKCLEGVESLEVGRAGALNETDVGTGFGEGDGASCADT